MRRVISHHLADHLADPLRIVALGDTHLFSTQQVAKETLERITEERPALILHTGDVYSAAVLAQFSQVAPVYAVRGNRDLLRWFSLPAIRHIFIGGLKISLFHGHGSFLQYLRMKRMVFRKDPAVFQSDFIFPPESGESDILIYGHTHFPRLAFQNNRIVLNPGALTKNRSGFGFFKQSFSVLTFFPEDQIEIKFLVKDENWHDPCKKRIDKDFFLQGETL